MIFADKDYGLVLNLDKVAMIERVNASGDMLLQGMPVGSFPSFSVVITLDNGQKLSVCCSCEEKADVLISKIISEWRHGL